MTLDAYLRAEEAAPDRPLRRLIRGAVSPSRALLGDAGPETLLEPRRVRAPDAVRARVGRRAAAASSPAGLAALRGTLEASGVWEPLAFVDACEAARAGGAAADVLEALADVQEAEWRVLVEHCAAVACGG